MVIWNNMILVSQCCNIMSTIPECNNFHIWIRSIRDQLMRLELLNHCHLWLFGGFCQCLVNELLVESMKLSNSCHCTVLVISGPLSSCLNLTFDWVLRSFRSFSVLLFVKYSKSAAGVAKPLWAMIIIAAVNAWLKRALAESLGRKPWLSLAMSGYDHNCCGKCLIKQSLGRKPWLSLAQLDSAWLYLAESLVSA